MSLLTHTDAGVDEELFKTVNREHLILKNEVARDACNIIELDEAEK